MKRLTFEGIQYSMCMQLKRRDFENKHFHLLLPSQVCKTLTCAPCMKYPYRNVGKNSGHHCDRDAIFILHEL